MSIIATCQLCGKEFKSYPSNIARGWDKYCSRICADKVKEQDTVTRFWKYTVVAPDGCWQWTGARDSDGYGLLTTRRSGSIRHMRMHRLSWEIHHGPIPDGLFVLHRCDNPPCARPDHLFLGNNKENATDRHMKGRTIGAAKGERNPMARLSDGAVDELRAAVASGITYAKVGAMFGVTSGHVSDIINGKKRTRASEVQR